MAIADPSAVYCEEMGYTYRLDKALEGEKGICVIKPGVEFKAWDFFKGKVGGEYSYCTKKGYDTESNQTDKGTYSTEYAVCVPKKTFLDNIKSSFGIKTNGVKISMHELMEENGDSLDLKSYTIEEEGQDYKKVPETYQDNLREIPTDSGGAGTPPNLSLFEPEIGGLNVNVNGIVLPGTLNTTITRIHWDWNDGSSEDHWFPASHTYTGYGEYIINVTAYQSDGLNTTETKQILLSTSPTLFDWRNYNGEDWVTPVKSQGSCGSCWAFSAVGTVEAKLNIDNNNSNLDYDLSEQELVSCANAGTCADGGWNYKSFNYIRDTGIADEACFPYVADDVACDLCPNWKDRTVGITNHHKVTATQAALKQALLDYGPLSVPVESTGWGLYSGGIFNGSNSGMDHLVLLVGYNDTGGYWIIKNSWGTSWGEDGYMRLSYTNNPITSFDVTYAVEQTILPIDRGELQLYLLNPTLPINVTKNKFFNFSTSVKCVDGYCGDITATLTLPPSEMTTCSEVWGGDCSEGPPESFDNTFDDCSSGFGGDESIGEVYLSKSSVEFGEEIIVACYFDIIGSVCGTGYANDNLYIYYRNSSSGAWQKKYYMPQVYSCNYYLTSFFPDNIEGEHQVRCIAGYQLSEGECGGSGGSNWYDNDDINFSVHNHTSGKGQVPMNYGYPFYTINQNPVSCMNMTNQSTCNQTWTINATGDINSGWIFYTIYSSNLPGVETNTTEKINLTIIEFTSNILNMFIELAKGWNLVSLPLNPLDKTLPSVLSSIQGNYSKIITYDTTSNESKIYDPNDVIHSNLNSIENEIGVWINMLNNDTLINEGYEIGVVSFNLKQGYNLISYPSLDENNVSYVFGNVSGDLVNVLTYENNEWKSYSPAKPIILNNLTIIKPGQAYWVKVNDTVSWDFIDGEFSSH